MGWHRLRRSRLLHPLRNLTRSIGPSPDNHASDGPCSTVTESQHSSQQTRPRASHAVARRGGCLPDGRPDRPKRDDTGRSDTDRDGIELPGSQEVRGFESLRLHREYPGHSSVSVWLMRRASGNVAKNVARHSGDRSPQRRAARSARRGRRLEGRRDARRVCHRRRRPGCRSRAQADQGVGLA